MEMVASQFVPIKEPTEIIKFIVCFSLDLHAEVKNFLKIY